MELVGIATKGTTQIAPTIRKMIRPPTIDSGFNGLVIVIIILSMIIVILFLAFLFTSLRNKLLNP